ncbi:hypothetical protein U1Q18_012014 [Sarracenia purpurea var. burkii]
MKADLQNPLLSSYFSLYSSLRAPSGMRFFHLLKLTREVEQVRGRERIRKTMLSTPRRPGFSCKGFRVEDGRRVQSTTIKGVGFDQFGRRTLIVYLVGLMLGILADKALNLAVVCLEGRRRRSKVGDAGRRSVMRGRRSATPR